jgi:hypothetical protein
VSRTTAPHQTRRPQSQNNRPDLRMTDPPRGRHRHVKNDDAVSNTTTPALKRQPRPREDGLASRTLPPHQVRRCRLKNDTTASRTTTTALKQWAQVRDDGPTSKPMPSTLGNVPMTALSRQLQPHQFEAAPIQSTSAPSS